MGHHHSHHHTHTVEMDNERKTLWVVIITLVTMVVEIVFGYLSGSMALLSDGWHMSTHALALGLAWVAYVVSRKYADSVSVSFSRERLLSLAGFTSAILLLVVAVAMIHESVKRLLHPVAIHYGQAILVAVIGMAVNGACAFVLGAGVGKDSDNNIRSAYMHVLADGLTSLAAIGALLCGLWWNLRWLDAAAGILSSLIIVRWAIQLILASGRTLIDYQRKQP